MGILRSWFQPEPINIESVFIVGLGRFGTAVAETLMELNADVLAVDTNRELVNRWADSLTACREVDATDVTALRQLKVEQFDAAVVAIGDNVEASILATAALIDLGVKNVWAKAITAEHGRILDRIGAHHVVLPEREMGTRVAHVLADHILDYVPLDENFVIAEVQAPAWCAGRALSEIGLRTAHNVTVVCTKEIGGQFVTAGPDTVLNPGDLMVIAGNTDDVHRFAGLQGA